ncbi:MAG: tetratricopeptide repeat protein [bacterium]|nr:tetratricopeptide repeat protein [bacterium]
MPSRSSEIPGIYPGNPVIAGLGAELRTRLVACALGITWLAGPGCGQMGLPSLTRGPTSSVEAAELALARGEVDQAARVFDRVLARKPGDARALLGSARAHLAAARGERAVERFAAYRARGHAWRKTEQWENCSALALAAEQVLADPARPARALELARRLEGEDCDESRTPVLLLRSGLAVADATRAAGDRDRALDLYLELLNHDRPGRPDRDGGASARAGNPERDDASRASAYLAASDILLEVGRREEALALLSRGLDELPGNRDLVHRMVTVLADGSSVVFPRAKPPAHSAPASPD